MIYVPVFREVLRRLMFHQGETLKGLKVVIGGEYTITGDKDLPQLLLVDMEATDVIGKSTGGISMFIRTARKSGWVKNTDDGPKGLFDWMEAVMDAVETTPEGNPDRLLIQHDNDGHPILDANGAPKQLLIQTPEWHCRMAEISTLAFTYQMDFSFSLVNAKRGRRCK